MPAADSPPYANPALNGALDIQKRYYDALRNASQSVCIEPAPGTPARKLTDAIAWLGTRWVLHPQYRPTPRHSNDPEIYEPARRPYLTRIANRAIYDRLSHL